MVVRIHNVSKWAALQPGDILELRGLDRRRVRVEFNCPAPTRIDVVEGDKPTFLAIVQGYEVVEFTAGAEVHLVATSEDEVWYFTNDGDQIAVERPEAVSFTKIASRRARNPDLELMMFKMEQNISRRTAALEAELAAMRAAQAPHDPETGEVEDGEVGDGTADGSDGEAAGGEVGGTEPAPTGQGAGAGAGAGVSAGPSASK
jgi:hypothetical protein